MWLRVARTMSAIADLARFDQAKSTGGLRRGVWISETFVDLAMEAGAGIEPA